MSPVRCELDDICEECGKSVREHIQEFRALGEAITKRVVRL